MSLRKSFVRRRQAEKGSFELFLEYGAELDKTSAPRRTKKDLDRLASLDREWKLRLARELEDSGDTAGAKELRREVAHAKR